MLLRLPATNYLAPWSSTRRYWRVTRPTRARRFPHAGLPGLARQTYEGYSQDTPGTRSRSLTRAAGSVRAGASRTLGSGPPA